MRTYVSLFGAVVLSAALALAGAVTAPAGAAKQKVTIVMTEYKFTPSSITLRAGTPVELKLVNRGEQKHEFMVYPPKPGADREELEKWGHGNSYFKDVELKVEGGGLEVVGTNIFEVEVEPGKSAELKFTPKRAGTFEMACLIEGHYEKGQKGTLVVR